MTSKNTKFVIQCIRCGKTFTEGFVPRCTSCKGATDVSFLQPQRIRDGESNPMRRYFDFMPVLDLDNAIWLGAPEPTPCIHAKNLGDVIGHPKVYLKDETKHPTRTTKDRMASGVLSYFREIGLWEFVSSSTGNSSTSFAMGAGAHPEFTIHLYCGEDFLYAMNWPDFPNVKLYVLKGATFVEAFDWDEIEDAYDRVRQVHDLNLDTVARAQDRADAKMRHQEIGSSNGEIVVPVNCGQELYDVISVTDESAGLTNARRRVLGLSMRYSPGGRAPAYEQHLSLRAV